MVFSKWTFSLWKAHHIFCISFISPRTDKNSILWDKGLMTSVWESLILSAGWSDRILGKVLIVCVCVCESGCPFRAVPLQSKGAGFCYLSPATTTKQLLVEGCSDSWEISRRGLVGGATCRKTPDFPVHSWEEPDDQTPLWRQPCGWRYNKRGTDTPVHRLEKPAFPL